MKIKTHEIFIMTLISLLIMAGDVVYIVGDKLIAKAVTSAMFVLLGLVCLVFALKEKTTKIGFSIMLFVGLIFAMLGDIVLEINFIFGAVLFAVAHIFYFISYLFISKFRFSDLICALLIFVPSLLVITLVPLFKFESLIMEMVCITYALIISLMVGKALSNFVENKSALTLVILIGSILFFFSDMMLLFNVFGNVPYTGIFCLATYYPAEIMLALSIVLARLKGNSNTNQ